MLTSHYRKLAKDSSQTEQLEQYWEQHGPATDGGRKSPVPSLPASPIQDRRGHKRNRSASDGAALSAGPEHKLSTHHPAWSLATMLDTFGPLTFPIYRAALLRKRILISCHAPVRQMCDFGMSRSSAFPELSTD